MIKLPSWRLFSHFALWSMYEPYNQSYIFEILVKFTMNRMLKILNSFTENCNDPVCFACWGHCRHSLLSLLCQQSYQYSFLRWCCLVSNVNCMRWCLDLFPLILDSNYWFFVVSIREEVLIVIINVFVMIIISPFWFHWWRVSIWFVKRTLNVLAIPIWRSIHPYFKKCKNSDFLIELFLW